MNNITRIRYQLLGPELIQKCLSPGGLSEKDLEERLEYLISEGVLKRCDLKYFKNLCQLSQTPPCLNEEDKKILQNIESTEIGNLVKQSLLQIKRIFPKDINLICFMKNIETFQNVTNYNEFDIISKILNYKSLLIKSVYEAGGNDSLISLDNLVEIYNSNKRMFDRMYSYFTNFKRNQMIQKEVFYTPNPTPFMAYLKFIQYYDDQTNGNIYFLGDSVFKFKMVYDLLKPDNTSKSIKFSGNKFLNKDLEDIFIESNINHEFMDDLILNAKDYYHNNKEIIDGLFLKLKKDEKIVIFDYLTSGVSLLTLVDFLKILNDKILEDEFKIRNNESIIFEKILFVNLHSYVEPERIFKILGKKINFITYEMDMDSFFFYHFINSDKLLTSNLCSRCIPKYSPELWNKKTEVYLEENSSIRYKNFLGCNISNLEIIIFLNFVLAGVLDINKIKLESGGKRDNRCEAITLDINNLIKGLNITPGDEENVYDIFYKIDF